jgi:cation:H+ antiporter
MRPVLMILGAVALTLPGAFPGLSSTEIDPLATSAIYGLAVVGAAFLLSWAAEIAQRDIPRSLALTILALIAVLPEYAVDMFLAWRAARDPETYGPLSLVNMAGANRLLIGIGWPTVVVIYWLRAGGGKQVTGVTIDPDQSIDVSFLGLATLYSFAIPIKGALSIFDLVVLVTISGLYAWRLAKARHVEPDLTSPARRGHLSDTQRRLITVALFRHCRCGDLPGC